jgi:hypothetical protein
MNFPMQYPIIQFFHWLVNTPGVGSAFVALAAIGSMSGYFLTIRSIRAKKDADGETYSYPTPALHHTDED